MYVSPNSMNNKGSKKAFNMDSPCSSGKSCSGKAI